VLQIGLLVAADVNWIVRVRLLRVARDSDWPQTWKRLLNDGAPEIGRQATTMPRRDCCSGRSSRGAIRSLAACHSATGSPLIAGDSHLALTIPGAWLAAAYHSPSFNLAGLMIPGILFMAIGRNPWQFACLWTATSSARRKQR
jgi:penicillin G amidase